MRESRLERPVTAPAVLLDRSPVPVRKILCAGRNYATHVGEMGGPLPDEPILFWKPQTALVRPDGGTLVLPRALGLVHHEIELALLLGEGGKNVTPAGAAALIAGCGVALDLTLREMQGKAKEAGGPWALAKGFDRSAPVGEFVSAADRRDLPIVLEVNGEVRQKGRTSEMIFPAEELLAYASRFVTLEAGDLLLTGTPEGIGPLEEGDEVVGRIGDLPELRLRVERC